MIPINQSWFSFFRLNSFYIPHFTAGDVLFQLNYRCSILEVLFEVLPEQLLFGTPDSNFVRELINIIY